MTKSTISRRLGVVTLAFATASTIIYLLMIRLTLPTLLATSGHIAFDMRPFGYSPQEAAQLLQGLGENGRLFYLTRQIPLDTLYPALLASTLICAFLWLGKRQAHTKIVAIGIALSLGTMLCDYAENLGIALMILNAAHLPDTLVYASSCVTVLKSAFTVAAVFCLLLLALRASLRPKRSRSNHANLQPPAG